MAMLGLGDIVIPGMMIAFALRFDLYLFYLRQQKQVNPKQKGNEDSCVSEDSDKMITKARYFSATGGWGERLWTSGNLQPVEIKAKQFPKTYFHTSLVGYILGMISTLIVMQVAEHAQPALLYLVPGVLISLWGTAVIKGDLKLMWEYTEDSEEGRDNDDKTKQKTLQQHSPKAHSTAESVAMDKEEERGHLRTEESATDSKEKEICRDLIMFSVALPPIKLTDPRDEAKVVSSSDKIITDIAEAMNDIVSGHNTQPRSQSAAPLPDVEADDTVMAKLEKTPTDEVAAEGNDGQQREKRRLRA
jgi:minor histocompatibility antigen H13